MVFGSVADRLGVSCCQSGVLQPFFDFAAHEDLVELFALCIGHGIVLLKEGILRPEHRCVSFHLGIDAGLVVHDRLLGGDQFDGVVAHHFAQLVPDRIEVLGDRVADPGPVRVIDEDGKDCEGSAFRIRGRDFLLQGVDGDQLTDILVLSADRHGIRHLFEEDIVRGQGRVVIPDGVDIRVRTLFCFDIIAEDEAVFPGGVHFHNEGIIEIASPVHPAAVLGQCLIKRGLGLAHQFCLELDFIDMVLQVLVFPHIQGVF